ncbi:MAG: YcxB family protein [candidate division Zixibacteria bacterium]|nr:YcxB family protein [candidate division Zixibacteria bacterium]
MDNNKNNTSESSIRDVNLTFLLTRDDLFWYNMYFTRLMVFGFFVLLILFMAGFIVIINTPSGDLQTTFVWVEIALGAGLSVCIGTIGAIALQIYFLKGGGIEKSMTERNYIISMAGIAVFTERSKIMRTWKDVIKVIKTRHGYYIRTGDKLAIIIPHRELKNPDDLQAFKEIIKINT